MSFHSSWLLEIAAEVLFSTKMENGSWAENGILMQQQHCTAQALTQSCITRSNEDANSKRTNLSECLCYKKN